MEEIIINPLVFTAISAKRNITSNFTGRRSHHAKRHPNSISNISKRMGIHSSAYKSGNPALVGVNIEKFDPIYKKDVFYLPDNYHDSSCDDIVTFISSGKTIESPYMHLSEKNGQLQISCIDGRHRYRVLKNMGMKIMPITMSQNSKKLAQKYGLIAIDYNA